MAPYRLLTGGYRDRHQMHCWMTAYTTLSSSSVYWWSRASFFKWWSRDFFLSSALCKTATLPSRPTPLELTTPFSFCFSYQYIRSHTCRINNQNQSSNNQPAPTLSWIRRFNLPNLRHQCPTVPLSDRLQPTSKLRYDILHCILESSTIIKSLLQNADNSEMVEVSSTLSLFPKCPSLQCHCHHEDQKPSWVSYFSHSRISTHLPYISTCAYSFASLTPLLRSNNITHGIINNPALSLECLHFPQPPPSLSPTTSPRSRSHKVTKVPAFDASLP